MNADNYVDGLELRIKELTEKNQNLFNALMESTERKDQLTTEIQKLKVALSKYGHHIEGCGHGWQCNCGYLELFRETK